jgi:ATP-dependent exoDNAse (exonuclease V) alpha subunit
MAIFHMQINTVSRSSGRNAPASAAYRAGERIRNELTGALYDHRNRRDVLHKEIVLPARLGAPPQWAQDRASLWNAAERIESRENSRVAREYMVALPAELSAEARVSLARTFSHEIAERYGVAVDLAVHAPRPFGDPRNFHAHLLTSTREVRPEGFGPKAGLDMNGTVRAELGLPSGRQEFAALRQRWAELVNEHLQAAQLHERVDARSLAAQGIDREPLPRLPRAAISAERRGEHSEVAEQIRERYRARVAARAERAAADRLASPRPAHEAGASASEPLAGAQARQRQAVQDWLEYRAARGLGAAAAVSSAERVRREALLAWRERREKGAGASASPTPARDSGAQPPEAAGSDRDLSW